MKFPIIIHLQPTFHYNSTWWTNKRKYEARDGIEGLTEKESKLASYWITPFKKICVGMTVNGESKWMTIDYEASSLYSLIADGQYRNTSAGGSAWRSLIEGASLMPYCNLEGFNIRCSKESYHSINARFAFAANSQNHCFYCHSWLGFGINFDSRCGESGMQACGNRQVCSSSIINMNAFGYILVQ